MFSRTYLSICDSYLAALSSHRMPLSPSASQLLLSIMPDAAAVLAADFDTQAAAWMLVQLIVAMDLYANKIKKNRVTKMSLE